MRKILLFVSGALFFGSFYVLHSSGWPSFGTQESRLALIFYLGAMLAGLFWHNLVLCARIKKLNASLEQREQELGILAEHH